VCQAIPPVDTRLAVAVLIHRHEHHKPSSTGRLITRVVHGATCHIYQRATRFFPAQGFEASACGDGRDLWILHPSGGPLAEAAADIQPDTAWPRVLLLDGTWKQAGEMLRSLDRPGRCVRLPDPDGEESRYWLRDQPALAHRSTAEALLGVLHAMGDHTAELRLRLHFELHVYATLLSRGRRELAERYLGHSPLLTEIPAFLDQLHARRSRDD